MAWSPPTLKRRKWFVEQTRDYAANLFPPPPRRHLILGVGDNKEAEDVIARLRLSPAAAEVVRHKLNGPDENGSGSPFLAVIEADNVRYEQMLVNSLGPVELWAFSTTPTDVALRNRLYEQVGFSEGLRRLSRVFPHGTARKEVGRRKDERLRRGEEEGRAQAGVIADLASELIDGHGLGIVLRKHEAEEAGLLLEAAR